MPIRTSETYIKSKRILVVIEPRLSAVSERNGYYFKIQEFFEGGNIPCGIFYNFGSWVTGRISGEAYDLLEQLRNQCDSIFGNNNPFLLLKSLQLPKFKQVIVTGIEI